MNPFITIFNAYVRWRHSRGFGVHSPFAYSIVKMAVRPGRNYGYYGYADIDRVILTPGFKGYPRSRSDARLLLRLLVELRTKRLLLPDGLPAMTAAATAASVPTILFSPPDCRCHPDNTGVQGSPLPPHSEGDLLVAVPMGPAPDILEARLAEGTVIFALNPSRECEESIYKACKSHGLILHGTRIILAIPRKEMAFTSYTMKF